MAAVTSPLPGVCLEYCPALVRETLRVVGSKWAVPVLVTLLTTSRPVRYAELRRRVAGITPKELAKRLRSLESSGLIQRTVYPTIPPQVDYRLTARGEATMPVIKVLASWGATLGDSQSATPPCAQEDAAEAARTTGASI
jgi:DNA-binding HxlR family transcriptional regulator